MTSALTIAMQLRMPKANFVALRQRPLAGAFVLPAAAG